MNHLQIEIIFYIKIYLPHDGIGLDTDFGLHHYYILGIDKTYLGNTSRNIDITIFNFVKSINGIPILLPQRLYFLFYLDSLSAVAFKIL
jgi:hypothetical protein